jgi:hypothetical protein
VANHCRRSLLSVMDWPRQSKINSCTPIAAKVRMSPAMSSGSPENDSPASFNGRFYRYSDIRCEPFPVQKPHPPIWVGGHSPAALRRTARRGDGWHPVGAVAASPLPPPEMRAHLDTLKQLTEAEGRDFSALTISYKAPLYDTGIGSRDGSRRFGTRVA